MFKFLPDISKVVFTEEHLSSIKPEKTKQRDKKSKSKSATASIAKSGVKARAKKVKTSKPSR